jgi:hypothetical protein
VATCDRELKRRIRKIPGVPIMYVANHKYAIERLPDAVAGAPKGQTQSETESDLDAVGKQSACVCVCVCVCVCLSLSLSLSVELSVREFVHGAAYPTVC